MLPTALGCLGVHWMLLQRGAVFAKELETNWQSQKYPPLNDALWQAMELWLKIFELDSGAFGFVLRQRLASNKCIFGFFDHFEMTVELIGARHLVV